MRFSALQILGVALLSGLSGLSDVLGCGSARAQAPVPAPAPAAAEPEPAALARGWAEVQRVVTQSVDQLSQREMWADSAYWRVALSPYTKHYRYSAEHRRVYAVAVERQRDDAWLAGAAQFRNSFGQPSSYAYVGRRFDDLLGEPHLFGQVSAGILYGYKGAFKTKVPLNFRGFAPGALVSAGWRTEGGFSTTLHLLGDAGVMLQFAYDLH